MTYTPDHDQRMCTIVCEINGLADHILMELKPKSEARETAAMLRTQAAALLAIANELNDDIFS